jgi:predicted AAA+ superfamily ATPase
MKRLIFQNLKEWRTKSSRMPLLLRGARQTGKTYLVRAFGEAYFEQMLYINFELQPQYKACFNTLEVHRIVQALELLSNQSLIPGKSLLVLDEIQECPEAISALRYFFELMPALHVVGTGSLLEFALESSTLSMPVGRVEFLYLYPMTFSEMLMALGEDKLVDYIQHLSTTDIIPSAVHHKLLDLLKLYLIIGGMPQVLATYINERLLLPCRDIQVALLNSYRADFAKYATAYQQYYCERVFEKMPSLIAQHFKYTDIDPDLDGRSIKRGIQLLCQANVLSPVYYTAASGLPLSATRVEKRYKALFLDIGLVQASYRLSPNTLINHALALTPQGPLAEQFVGQHLLTLQSANDRAELFYWQRDTRGSQAEVDYVLAIEDQIVPIEVKSGKQGKLKSMHLFMDDHPSKIGIKLSHEALDTTCSIWTVPLYLVEQLPRWIMESR